MDLPEEIAYMKEHLMKSAPIRPCNFGFGPKSSPYGTALAQNTENFGFIRRYRRMETKGGEVRRVHIVYLLSRKGRIENPHLFRVHHINHNGVRLRDVKRWLAELRGKEMPESFAWSYKRRYKNGYVWQDLLDDDLITPISDNEYFLKGSEISSSPLDEIPSSLLRHEQPQVEKLPERPRETETDKLANRSVKFKPDDDDKTTEETDTTSREKTSGSSSSSLSSFSGPEEFPEKKTDSKKSSSATFTKSKSSSSGVSYVFRNLLSCGAIDTNDSVLRLLSRHKTNTNSKNRSSKSNSSGANNVNTNKNETHPNQQVQNLYKGEICKCDIMGGSERYPTRVCDLTHQHEQARRKSFSGVNSSKKTTDSGNQKTPSAVFKPIAEPYCSQCRKAFKPEKLHTHMKSCRGLKGKAKGNAGMESQSRKKPTAQGQLASLFLTDH